MVAFVKLSNQDLLTTGVLDGDLTVTISNIVEGGLYLTVTLHHYILVRQVLRDL